MAVRFTYDDWMHQLYGRDPDKDKFATLYKRVDCLIWRYAKDLLERDVDVIIDSGFWTRASRDIARKRVEEIGARPVLYRIKCSEELMRRRVARRSEEVSQDSLWINDAAFNEFKGRFEDLEDDEEHVVIDGTIEQGGAVDALTRATDL